jgi:pterin-4a-carbinolamine dehydratase
MKSLTISVSVAVPPAVVAHFVRDPLNLPIWAPAFCRSVARVRGDWIVQSPLGAVRFAFVPDNPYGVLDHSVWLPTGQEICNPMRVIAHAGGSEILFTLFRQDGQSDAELERDVDLVWSDLQTLRQVLELLVANDLSNWQLVSTDLPADGNDDVPPRRKTELHRVFEFARFEDAMAFMQAAVPKIAALDHHPRWENRWCEVSIWLSSWDAGWQPAPADIELARYLDVLRQGFPAVERDEDDDAPAHAPVPDDEADFEADEDEDYDDELDD